MILYSAFSQLACANKLLAVNDKNAFEKSRTYQGQRLARFRTPVMTTATAQLLDHSAEKPRSIPAFGRLWLIAFVLVVLAAEAGWVALLGYAVVFLFS